ncbi:MAG: hypothetical protein ACRCVW_03155 [Brevinema sp.]
MPRYNNIIQISENCQDTYNAISGMSINEKVDYLASRCKLLSRKYYTDKSHIDNKTYITELKKIFKEMFDALSTKHEYTIHLPKAILNNIGDKNAFFRELKDQISSSCGIKWKESA